MRRLSGGAGTGGGPGDSWAANTITTIVFAWTATQLKLSIDGGAFAATGNTAAPNLAAATTADIGSSSSFSAGQEADVRYRGFVTGSGTLTDADAATIYAALSGDRTRIVIGDFPGTPTSWWLPRDNSLIIAA